MLTLDKVRLAGFVLKDVAHRTDMLLAAGLSPDCEVYLKTENLQRTGSFKLRGAYYKMSTLSESERALGVVACSAGNHAQGVALAAKCFGIRATIFLPSTAPISKIEATRRYGAEIRLVDGVYDDACAAALAFRDRTGALFLHPFDDEDVIARQGTVALEILEQLPDADAIVVPVGGGGLIAGIAYTVKAMFPSCRVYGVQAAGADGMERSLREGRYRCLESVSTFADGIAVMSPGRLTYDYCLRHVDGVVTVSDDEIATAILALMERQKLVAEGAGAAAVAAVIAGEGANIIRVQYTPGGENMDINGCYLKISMETRDRGHLQKIRRALEAEGFRLCGETA